MTGIKKVAEDLGIEQHVLRFWETQFRQIKPVKKNGRRIYSPSDIELLRKIKNLLYIKKYTIKGAQQFFKNNSTKNLNVPLEKLESILNSLNHMHSKLNDLKKSQSPFESID